MKSKLQKNIIYVLNVYFILNINSIYLNLYFPKEDLGGLYQYKLLTLLIRGVIMVGGTFTFFVFKFFTIISSYQGKKRCFHFLSVHT